MRFLNLYNIENIDIIANNCILNNSKGYIYLKKYKIDKAKYKVINNKIYYLDIHILTILPDTIKGSKYDPLDLYIIGDVNFLKLMEIYESINRIDNNTSIFYYNKNLSNTHSIMVKCNIKIPFKKGIYLLSDLIEFHNFYDYPIPIYKHKEPYHAYNIFNYNVFYDNGFYLITNSNLYHEFTFSDNPTNYIYPFKLKNLIKAINNNKIIYENEQIEKTIRNYILMAP